MAITAVSVTAATSSMAFLTRHRPKCLVTPIASLSAQSTPPLPSKKLVLYTKPGCCLCDGLKEKLQAAFSLAGPDSLHDVHLQVTPILPSFFFASIDDFLALLV